DYKTGNQYFVAVQYPEDPNRRLEDVLNIPATGTNQSHPVKLGTLVTIRPGTAPVEVNHVSLARVFNVLVNTEGKDIGAVAGGIRRKLRRLQREEWGPEAPPEGDRGMLLFPGGMRVSLRGEYSRMNESFGSLGFGLAMAAVLVYLLLVALFRSYLGPF